MVSPTAAAATPPTFRHDDAGTPEQQWLALPDWDGVRALEPFGPSGARRLVVVAAHPDDESLGAGGLIATAAELGVPVEVVVLTDGAASHPGSTSVTGDALAALRADETRSAVTALAPLAGVHLVGLPDGELARHVDAAVTALVAVVGERGPDTLLVAPWRGDGHTDHEAASVVASTAAVRTDSHVVEYPIWLWHWGTGEDVPWHDLRGLRLDDGARAAKAAALAAHASQVTPLSDGPGDEALLSPSMLAHFDRPHEVFVTPRAPHDDDAFERLHREVEEPWDTPTSWYEQRKRAVTLAALPHQRYGRALEVGCSTGQLARALADRCDHLLALDRADSAVERARAAIAGQQHVEVRRATVPRDWPHAQFDLVVVSEVGYFLSPLDLDGVIDRVERCLAPDGAVVLCHWRHPIEGWPLTGDRVHERWAERTGRPPVVTHLERDFALVVHAARGVSP
ncbi:bifunctional PIG-L family deacetylase/class I SAM-dependent methyltransferase [Terracoccus luteus]|uniref:bifunctional PIG-L family deacetylase/class I SAM-dependent methyltransferase n=1 Tax=Terracoccus luteus TaxID=53356 RepID=UPI000EB0445B|nr:bifunctional PIG-L family deacetylase/class I SAM-dependent methyltransferase [Terracoccus luteus]